MTTNYIFASQYGEVEASEELKRPTVDRNKIGRGIGFYRKIMEEIV